MQGIGTATVAAVAAAASGGAAAAADSTPHTVNTILPEDSLLSTGMVMTSSARNNVYSTGQWSSSGPNSTYYNSLNGASDWVQAWNMLMGDGYPKGTSQHFYVNDDGDTFHRELIYAHNRRMGHNYRDMFYYDNASTGQDYAGVTFSCCPVRNHGSSSQTISMLTYRSSGSGNYGGAGVMYYTPTFSSGTNYANANGGAWTLLNSYTSSNDQYGYNASVVVPAGTTVLFFMSSAHRYHTTYRFKDTHNHYDLHTAFTETNNVKCDLRMLQALYTGREPDADYNASTPWEIYNTCATLYGDR
jgi:hypothetical protein